MTQRSKNWAYVAAAAAMGLAGIAVAALVDHRVARPIAHPDSGQNDGSTLLAFVIFAVPMSLLVLASWRRRVGVLVSAPLGLALAIVCFAGGVGVGALL